MLYVHDPALLASLCVPAITGSGREPSEPLFIAVNGGTDDFDVAQPAGLGTAVRVDASSLVVRRADSSIDAEATRARCSGFAVPRLAAFRCSLDEAAVLSSCLGLGLTVACERGGARQCDRAIVPEAREVASLSFEEAAELSRFADTGVDPSIVGPLARYRVPARVRALAGPGAYARPDATGGTLIDESSDSRNGPVKAIARQYGVAMLSVSGACLPGMAGMAARVFESVARAGASVLLITQSSSEYSICFCVGSGDEAVARAAVEGEFRAELEAKELDPVGVARDLAILTLIGDGMRRIKGIAGKCFTQLARADVNIVAIAQGSSERSISAVVAGEGVDRGVRMIYQAFFDSAMPIDLFVIGCGNVGSALLSQLAAQAGRLEGHDVAARVVAVANSRRMLVSREGVDPAAWKGSLDADGVDLDLGVLLAMGSSLANPVLVDCTAGDAIPGAYPDFMLAGFHVVTPNKRGNAGPMDRYLALKAMALRHRRKYLYETTVGAGLPVIENLQNLLHAGDSLESFSGILSGSLSFLFGRLEDGVTFSAAVREAMEKGFTEPDPRDDLSGADVARKVLILAREAGLSMELKDVALEGLVPEPFMALSKDGFLSRLAELDPSFEALRAKAAAEGKALRFVGSIEGGRGRVGLQAVGPDHPLRAVKGGENALAFTTRYYKPVPLLLRGYGAGATVTAAGIFADILRTLNWIREA